MDNSTPGTIALIPVGTEKLDRLGIEPRTPTKANGRSTTELPALQVCRRSVEPQIPTDSNGSEGSSKEQQTDN